MDQDVSGGNTAVEQPKNDYTSPNDEQVKVAAEVEPLKAEQEADVTVEADPEDDAGDGKKKGRKGGFQKKIARLEAQIAELSAKQAPQQQEAPKFQPDLSTKPKLEDYADKTWEQYNEALTDWKIEQREQENNQKTKAEESKRDNMTKAQKFEAQKAEMREKYSDFDERLESYDGPTSQSMNVAIVESDFSGEVLNYLGNHYDEAEKLSKLSLIDAHKFVAKIEARIESEKSKDTPAPKISKAPAPVKPVGSGQRSVNKAVEEMTGDEYLVYERSRLREKNR